MDRRSRCYRGDVCCQVAGRGALDDLLRTFGNKEYLHLLPLAVVVSHQASFRVGFARPRNVC